MPFSMQARRKGIQAQRRLSDHRKSSKQSAFSTAVVTVIHVILYM